MDGYYEIANNLVAGHGFTRSTAPPFTPDSNRTPLYPLIIAGTLLATHTYKTLFILQMFAGALSVLLGWLIARKILGAGAASLAVGIVYALEPLGAYLTGVIMSETFFTTIFLGAVYLLFNFVRDKKTSLLLTVAILLGLATLIKPTTLYLPLFLLPFLWLVHGRQFTKRLFTQAALFVGIFVLVLSPWLYRNEIVFGNPSLVVQPVVNLYAFLTPSTIALEQNISFEHARNAFFAQEGLTSIEEIDLSTASAFKERAFAELRTHPVGLLKSVGVSLYAFFINDGYATVLGNSLNVVLPHRPPFSQLLKDPDVAFSFARTLLTGPALFVVLGRAFWMATTLFALWGAWRYWRARGLTPELVLMLSLIAYFALTTMVIGLSVNGRFRIPVDVLIFILAAYALRNREPEKAAVCN